MMSQERKMIRAVSTMTVKEISDRIAMLAPQRIDTTTLRLWRRVLLDEREHRMARNEWSGK